MKYLCIYPVSGEEHVAKVTLVIGVGACSRINSSTQEG